jgi:hypothetical protein
LPAAEAPWKQANGTSASETPKYERSKGFFTSNRVVWIAVTGVVVIIILGSCLLISTCYRGRKESIDIERHDVGTYKSRIDEPNSKSSFERNNQEKGNLIIAGPCSKSLNLSTLFCVLLPERRSFEQLPKNQLQSCKINMDQITEGRKHIQRHRVNRILI